jgi:hypothetical protein
VKCAVEDCREPGVSWVDVHVSGDFHDGNHHVIWLCSEHYQTLFKARPDEFSLADLGSTQGRLT